MFAARKSRSAFRPAISWVQARSAVPTTASAGSLTPVRKTSLTSRPPIVSMGRISIPGVLAGTWNMVSPSCFAPPVPVRATSRMCSARCALEIHVL